MSKQWPLVKLSSVLKQVDTSVLTAQLSTIDLAGVYSFGRGLFKRGDLDTGGTTYKKYNRLVTGDFVISQPKAWEGALALVTEEFNGWYLSPVFPTFRVVPDKLHPEYLAWYCRQRHVWASLQHSSRGIGARRESVSPSQFLALEIPLPPLVEQRRLVARIEALAELITEAQSLRKEAMEEAEALAFSRTSQVFDALVSAPVYPIKSLGVGGENPVQTGPFGAQLHASEFVEEGCPVLNVGNVWPTGLRVDRLDYVLDGKAEQLERYAVKGGDLLFARSGATLGKVCLVPEECDGWLMTGHLFRVRFDPERVDNRFAFAALRAASSVREQVFGTIRGATRPGFNTTLLSSVQLPLPDLAIQRRIVRELDALQAEVDGLKRLQADTQAELDALLPAVLEGVFNPQAGTAYAAANMELGLAAEP